MRSVVSRSKVRNFFVVVGLIFGAAVGAVLVKVGEAPVLTGQSAQIIDYLRQHQISDVIRFAS
jgi:hypothetical protein